MDPTRPLALGRQESGVLDWIERADEQGLATFEILTDKLPPKHPERMGAWWMRQLRTLEDDGLGFFFVPLTRRKPNLHCRLVQGPRNPGRPYDFVQVELSVPQMLGLPNEHPASELANIGQFFQWARDKAVEATGDLPVRKCEG